MACGVLQPPPVSEVLRFPGLSELVDAHVRSLPTASTGRASKNLCEDVSWGLAERLRAEGFVARVFGMRFDFIGRRVDMGGSPTAFWHVVVVVGQQAIDLTANQFAGSDDPDFPVPYVISDLRAWGEWIDPWCKYKRPKLVKLDARICNW